MSRLIYSLSVLRQLIDHLNLKLCVVGGHTSTFQIEILKVQDFGIFELSPMYLEAW